MTKNSPNLTNRNLERARALLFKTTRVLDNRNIVYHLEGGTLLGIVRDHDLLPWDHDVDISIPFEHAGDLIRLKAAFFMMGYKMSVRTSKKDVGPVKKGDYSVFKIKPLWSYAVSWFIPRFKNAIVLDIFVKKSDEIHTYWQAMDKVMRVDRKYYQSFDTVSYLGNMLKAPNHYTDYLTEKYGNWSIPVKDWSCATDEQTVIQ